jgi:hypothetical protein
MELEYTGKWPTLCSGHLTVTLDGEVYDFGSYVIASGGECLYLHETKSTEIIDGPWFWRHPLQVPDGFPEDRLPELLALINDEVEHGCCGGCL